MDRKNDAFPYYDYAAHTIRRIAEAVDHSILYEDYRKTIDIEGEVVQNVKQLPQSNDSAAIRAALPDVHEGESGTGA